MRNKQTNDVEVPCPFCGSRRALSCQLDTVPKSFAVICEECGAQGPTAEDFAGAVDEWSERGVVDSLSNVELDTRLVALTVHARTLRDEIASGDVTVEQAVALGAICGVVRILEGLCDPSSFGLPELAEADDDDDEADG